MSYAGKTILFQYDADHNRTLQVAPEGTTYYLPDGELTPSTGQGGVWHTYCGVPPERLSNAVSFDRGARKRAEERCSG